MNRLPTLVRILYLWQVCLLAFGSGALLAQDSEELLRKEQAAFGNAVALVADSVVQIETFGGLERVGDELIAEGPTTGTIVAADGWIISSLFSFRQQPASILVTLPDKTRVAARIVSRDTSRELALLKVDVGEALPVAQTAPKSDLVVGQWTIALGKTYDRRHVSQSVGIISALGRAYDKAIQSDAKISPINYGGPLIDLSGRVIGILAPISPGAFLEGDSSQLYDSGVGFAIPIEDVLSRLPRMQAGEDIHNGKLGIVASDQNEFAGPVRVAGAAPGSPAAKAGVQAGDVIVQAGGRPIELLAELRHALGPVDAGQSLPFAVSRDGRLIEMECELVKEIPIYRRRYLGVRLAETESNGVRVSHVEPESPASRSELQVGDQIVRCHGQEITSKEELIGRIAVAELDQPLSLEIRADEGQTRQLDVELTTWPDELPAAFPPVDPRIQETMPVEIVEVTLGDFPNKSFAIIPPLSGDRELGLLVLFPEPGELDQDRTKNFWESFARDHGWIVAVIHSGNARAWSREEVELAGRVIGRMDKSYAIDKSRTVIGGLGVGGRMALVAAAMERKRVSGVATIGTELKRLALRERNAPLQSVDFLLVGDQQSLSQSATILKESGYAVSVLSANEANAQKWEALPQDQILRWLEGLGRT